MTDEQCAACKNPVDDEFLRAMGKLFHVKCLVCASCKRNLSDEKFIPSDGKPYCNDCHAKNFGKVCKRCNRVIVADAKGVVTALESMGGFWHEGCFNCSDCNVAFQPGVPKKGAYNIGGMPFCHEHATKRSAPPAAREVREPCFECGKELTGAIVSALGQKFHKECFVCHTCKVQLGSRSFFEARGQVYCEDCDKKGFANLCRRCDKEIVPDEHGKATAVKAGGHTYHQECYTCEEPGCGLRFDATDKDKAAYSVGQKIFCKPHAEAALKAKK